jgi:hypothetical protein
MVSIDEIVEFPVLRLHGHNEPQEQLCASKALSFSRQLKMPQEDDPGPGGIIHTRYPFGSGFSCCDPMIVRIVRVDVDDSNAFPIDLNLFHKVLKMPEVGQASLFSCSASGCASDENARDKGKNPFHGLLVINRSTCLLVGRAAMAPLCIAVRAPTAFA